MMPLKVGNTRYSLVKATTGQMGVLPGHVPATAELKHGILSIHEGNDPTKYFLSSGFAFIRANSVADMAAPKGLAEFSQKLSSAVKKAEAQIGIDVQSVLNAALAG
ncbi:hypothetical protein K2173_003672 [Erythroxylum novogranatense]|uniref:ATP synthase F1 complex delta/epsilon subunit N-terminal domain-containing protein n=1 Tax=Erythroxylum novogranatense TaxID=1862640 RepID=A0AAV8TCM1_9ROSI|nr:hypothetical protein K2173_003672 [Erythroxylum novogranatense]